MRNSRVVGFAIAGILAVGSIAQAQSATTQPQQQRHATKREARGGRGRAGLLRGITLSDAEKTQVKAIHAKYSAEAKSLRESLRPAMQDMRAARQKRDSAAVKATWERTAGDRQKLQALMQRERAEIRSALTPEHQLVFDANAKTLEQRRADWSKNGKGERGARAERRGRRGVSQS
ncbi:MAG: Spy/CpxP family protein refolding chaperone [Gemmatimonadaceae bacterium]